MTQTVQLKAGDTFLYSGVVSGLSMLNTWSAASSVSFNGAVIASLTVTLVNNSDYATTGNLLLTISATGAQTLAWLQGLGLVRALLACDVRFSNSGSDPIMHSDTFIIDLSAEVTP